MSDQLLGFLGLLGTVGFGVLSIFQAWWSIAPKKLYWGFNTETISTGGGRGEISITYENRHFTEVQITRIAIWNPNRAAISGTEISQADPLYIVFHPDTEVLSTSVLDQTGVGVGVRIEVEQKSAILLFFDILNRADGFSIRVLHSASEYPPILVGTIKDVRRMTEMPIEMGTPKQTFARRIAIGAGVTGAMFVIIIVALVTLVTSSSPEAYLQNLRGIFSSSAVVVGVLFLMSLAALGVAPMPDRLWDKLFRKK